MTTVYGIMLGGIFGWYARLIWVGWRADAESRRRRKEWLKG